MKKITNRIRPTPPEKSRRYFNLRALENNCSMPSGDTAQAALFAFFLKYEFPDLYLQLGGNSFAWKWISLVAFARVFHHCHFFGDTIIGALLGYLVATAFSMYEIIIPVHVMHAI